MKKTGRYIRITGLVQGVGFRPFIYRHARKHGLTGWVRNHSGGVDVMVEGSEKDCSRFISTLKNNAPPASLITLLKEAETEPEQLAGFYIRSSVNGHNHITDISPDIAVCHECLKDMTIQQRRLSYPFTNCTHCGPRFSIIRSIPYDRSATSMREFRMCEDCRQEYTNVNNRRFHAQPVCCIKCGPAYKWISDSGTIEEPAKCLSSLFTYLNDGKIIALKSTSGFQLICDASNKDTVRRLRQIKQRNSRPFAMMFKNMDELKKHTFINSKQKEWLQSWRRPIVILQDKKGSFPEVNGGFTTIGAVLPYTPLHHIIMENSDIPALVFTSANAKSSPLIFENDKAMILLQRKSCDVVLYHHREIINNQDDSIVKIHDNGTTIIRRARGFTPQPVNMDFDVEGILALGGDLKNSFCIGKDRRAIMSQYMGDLENFEVFLRFRKSINNFSKLFKFKPQVAVQDLHPDYHSSRYAHKIAEQYRIPEERRIAVQHHHAHIASVMAEHQLDGPVLGAAMDGTGYGTNGKIWGSEFMICDLQGYQRKYHLDYMPLPGGDMAVKEPWRLATALGHKVLGTEFLRLPLAYHRHIPMEKQQLVIKAVDAAVNIAWSCGLGRLFDAVAALLNLVHHAEFEGEGPMMLENICGKTNHFYKIPLQKKTFTADTLIREVIRDLMEELPASEISARFHNSIVRMLHDGISRMSEESGLKRVALSGGVFQNKIITDGIYHKLSGEGFHVYLNEQVPCNDGGIALGQLAIARQLTQFKNKKATNC